MNSSKNIGNIGENIACEYILKVQNKKIIERNYHSRYGEIDIISADDKYINFIEVKTRKSNTLIDGIYSVDKSKQIKVIKTAEIYLMENDMDLQPKFDVVLITTYSSGKYKLEYIDNAFSLEDFDEVF
ncbi:MAG: YraN family protein [Clostridia bacterium]|nr:YraN family protein [Clostridia bacterium]